MIFKGIARNLSIFLSQPFIVRRNSNLSASFSFDIANSERKDNINTNKTIDKIVVERISLSGNHFDKFSGITYGNIRFSKRLDIIGNTKTGGANMTRARGVSDFFKIDGEISRRQRITDKLQLLLGINAQKSSNILLSSEEFGIGGNIYGRAYDSYEITGEDGIASKIGFDTATVEIS